MVKFLIGMKKKAVTPMAKVKETTVRVVRIEYKQEREDADYGSCMWATFDFDLEKYSLAIMSDCGNYAYGWKPTPDSESFLHLMSRIDEYYLLGKIADRTVVDSAETFKAVKEYFEGLLVGTDCELDEFDWQEIKSACSERSDFGCLDALKESIKYTELDDLYSYYDLAECIQMTESAGAKKIAEVFAKHIQTKIKSMEQKGR